MLEASIAKLHSQDEGMACSRPSRNRIRHVPRIEYGMSLMSVNLHTIHHHGCAKSDTHAEIISTIRIIHQLAHE